MSKIGPFVLGGTIGAIAALLYAPRAGEQTRALVSEKINAVWGEAKDFGGSAGTSASAAFKDVSNNAASFMQNVQSKGQEFVNSATGKVQEATGASAPSFKSNDNDELREKIEAARERIAAQVLKNAEASAASSPVEATVEAVVDTAADAAETVADAAADIAAQASEAVAEAVETAASEKPAE